MRPAIFGPEYCFAPAPAPKVSAIVTCYNLARFLGATLDSLLTQPYAACEIIVVDDGSTDGSRALLDAYAAKGKIRLVMQPNRGSAAARNAGAAMARGDYLAFLDGDDLATPARLIAPIAALEQNRQAGLAYGHVTLIDEYGQFLYARDRRARFREGWIADTLRYRNFIIFSTITVRAELFRQLGGFNEAIHSSEDWEFLYRLARRHPVVYVDECLVHYRIRQGSKTMDVRAKDRAIRAVQEMIFLDTTSPVAQRKLPRLAHSCRMMGLAGICLKMGNHSRAALVFLKALWLHPAGVWIYRAEIGDGLRRRLYPFRRQFPPLKRGSATHSS